MNPTCHPERPHHAKGLCKPCYYGARRKASTVLKAVDNERAKTWYRNNRASVLKKRRAEWAALPPEHKRALTRKKWLRERYEMSPDDYAAMIIAQGGKCGICEQPFKAIDVDHDHETGVVRGLLCRACNLGIAFFEKHAAKARLYLQAAASKHGAA